jgi:CBS-domain-containing membrane protein
MTPDVATVPESLTVEELLDGELAGHRQSTFPLTTDTGVAGLVTLDRIRRVPPAKRGATTLADIACPLAEVATASPTEPVADLLPRMSSCADGRALVLQNDRLVGIVTPTDISRAVQWYGVRARPYTGSSRPHPGAESPSAKLLAGPGPSVFDRAPDAPRSAQAKGDP